MMKVLLCCMALLFSVTATSQSQYSKLRTYSPYISPYNLDLIYETMKYKQKVTDINKSIIQKKINLLFEAVTYLNENEISLTTEEKHWLDKQLSWIDGNINNVDYSIKYNTEVVGNWLDDVRRIIYTWCNDEKRLSL